MMSVILTLSLGVLSSPSVAEFERVKRSAWARAAQPGGGVDLLRLAELGPWCDRETVLSTLRRAGNSRRFSHLNRAIAWWSIRELALEVMDIDMARDAAQELGLITQFVMRSGAAPPADESLEPKAWRPYPENAGSGVIHLDAFLYPNRETRATIATNLILPKARSAVLRIGYDDAVAVWLNGEEVYRSEAEHQSFLDQSAIAVQLQAGPNRLMVEVRQGTGAWRFMGRLTTADGAPLKVKASPQPWSPTKARVGGVPKAIETIWNPLYKRTADEPPDPVALRDLADYARLAHLPDRDQTMVQIALEGAYEVDGSAKTLRAWVRLLQDARRARLLDRQSDAKIMDEADEFAALQLALEQANLVGSIAVN